MLLSSKEREFGWTGYKTSFTDAARDSFISYFCFMDIAALRREYTFAGLRRRDLAPDPIEQFRAWFEQALAADIMEPNAMTLATVDAEGQPSSRIVLLKMVDERGFVFFTSYLGRKAQELALNPK